MSTVRMAITVELNFDLDAFTKEFGADWAGMTDEPITAEGAAKWIAGDFAQMLRDAHEYRRVVRGVYQEQFEVQQ